MASDGQVDWAELAARSGGSARRAVGELLPPGFARNAVDTFVLGAEGAELARSILMLTKPAAGRERCLEIWRSAAPLSQRVEAVYLFQVVAVAEVLPEVRAFLDDPSPEIQVWGISALRNMIYDGEVGAEAVRPLLDAGSRHANPGVKRQVEEILEWYSREREDARLDGV
jgi:hypothetical protein